MHFGDQQLHLLDNFVKAGALIAQLSCIQHQQADASGEVQGINHGNAFALHLGGSQNSVLMRGGELAG